MLGYDFDFTRICSLIPEWSWRELYFGFNRELISEDEIISFAINQNSTVTDQFKIWQDRHYVNKRIDIGEKVFELAKDEETASEEETLKKWIYAVILHGYIFNTTFVYDIIEDVYAEFDYPKYLATLVRYMPYDGEGNLHDKLEKHIADGKKNLVL